VSRPPAGLITAHRGLAVAIVLIALLGVIWAGYVASRMRGGGRLGLYGSLTTAALALQAVFGIVLAAAGARPQDGLHFLFGPFTLLALPGARGIAAVQSGSPRTRAVVVAAGWVVTLGLSLRAVGTGGGIG
jgi:Zn-dependent protease